ncbi:MAG: hypothetical protein CME29_07795 [Gemmatimonadetes bacterium]|nr:hypothetical protein [Gemmatimonadota bacterium]|tara:strand:+ start:681 stop:1559 length:879 start_codon:yes stop_codon:yes gene_type:complete
MEGVAGDRIVLMGPNGSGKTTLLSALATELNSKGSVEVLGHSADENLQEVRRRIAFAGDRPVHLEELSGIENAQLFADLYGLERQYAESVLDNLFTRFGLSKVKHFPVSSYSHGMKKKLQLVEGFVHSPELLILDEPTLGLDPLSLEEFIDFIVQFKKGCVVMATNDPLVATKVATSVVFLMDGSVVAKGSPQELLDQLDEEVKVEIWTSGSEQKITSLESDGMVARVSPDKIVANMPSDVAPLPELMKTILRAGFEISRVEIARPDLSDVFLMLTGRSLTEESAVAREQLT